MYVYIYIDFLFFFQGLLKVHDQLSENAIAFDVKDDPVTEDYSFKDYGEGAVKIVHLEKTTEPLVSLDFNLVFVFWFKEF